MKEKEKFPKQEELEPRIREEELRGLDIKTIKNVQNQFGISYEDLKKLSKKEVENLVKDTEAIERRLEAEKGLGISEEQKKELKIAAKDMYEQLLKDAEESGDEAKVKIYQEALKEIEKKEQG